MICDDCLLSESQKPGVSITTLMIEPEESLFDLQMDLGQLADLALPSELSTWVMGLSVCLSVCLSVSLSVCLSVCLSIYIYLSFFLSIFLSVYLSIYLSIIYLSIYLSYIYLSIYLSNVFVCFLFLFYLTTHTVS